METSSLKKAGSGSGSEGPTHSVAGGRGGEERGSFEYFGWVYHIGVNSIGHEYCHLRFLFIRRKYVELYKRDPHENPGIVRVSFIFYSSYCLNVSVVLLRRACES